MFVPHRTHAYRPQRSVTGIALLFYMQIMFVPHRKHTYWPSQPVTGIFFTSWSSQWGLSSWLSHQYLVGIRLPLIPATCPATPMLPDLTPLIILREGCKFRSSSLFLDKERREEKGTKYSSAPRLAKGPTRPPVELMPGTISLG
jgi:hypothetical protein